MSDKKSDNAATNGAPKEAAQENNAPQFNIARIYLKDCSLELPNAPQIFLEAESPEIEVSLDMAQEKISGDTYETTIAATITSKLKAKSEEKTVFLIEVKQAGIFNISNLTEEQLERVLNINCPTILFPYLRAQISDLVSRAGLPPLQLNDVNFEAIYRQRQENAKETNEISEQ